MEGGKRNVDWWQSEEKAGGLTDLPSWAPQLDSEISGSETYGRKERAYQQHVHKIQSLLSLSTLSHSLPHTHTHAHTCRIPRSQAFIAQVKKKKEKKETRSELPFPKKTNHFSGGELKSVIKLPHSKAFFPCFRVSQLDGWLPPYSP